MRYRSDIDGLRAVAVIPVILFHAGLGPFPGGYVGVDVFFVISGFLITWLLVEDMETGNYSIAQFYERRARRILPALVLVLVATTLLMFRAGIPDDIEAYSASLAWTAGFAANVYFWLNLDYFDQAAEYHPLLHMWSLAVEEQFYILFPIVLALLMRLRVRARALWLWGAAAASLLVCSIGIADYPEATFYLLPTRAWELLAGALCALSMRQNPEARKRGWAALVGLIMILIAIFAFTHQTPYPSHFTLLPVLGTVLILRHSCPGSLTFRALSWRPMVAIGLISYSAYLWHQPLIVLARLRLSEEPSPLIMVGLVLLTLALAALTWKFVEQPFRGKTPRLLPQRTALLASSAVVLVALAAIGMRGTANGGYRDLWMKVGRPGMTGVVLMLEAGMKSNPDPFPGECRIFLEEEGSNAVLIDEITDRLIECAEIHGPGVAITGDSHARDLFRAVRAYDDRPFLVGLTGGGCRPLAPSEPENRCAFTTLRELLAEHPDMFAAIIHEQMARALYHDPDIDKEISRAFLTGQPLDAEMKAYELDRKRIRNTINYFADLPGNARLFWLGPRPEPHISHGVIGELGCTYPYRFRDNAEANAERLDRGIARMVEERGKGRLTYLSQIEMLDFKMPEDLLSCEELYWEDGDHLSSAGELRFGKRLDLLNRLGL